MSVAALKRALAEDEVFIRYKNILRMATRTSGFTTLVEELENLHKGRKSRTLHLKEPSVNRLVDAVLQDASYRSRCVEIIIITSKTQRLLESGIEAIGNHILSKYRDYLADYRTKADKEAVISSILQPAHDKIAEISRIIEIAEYVVEDIDKCAWSMKAIMEGLQLMYSREIPVKTSI